MMIFLFNIILFSSCLLLISADYSYKNADEWKKENSQCGGSQQSPIDVSREDIENLNETSKIKFPYIFDTVPERLILKNNGHTLKLLFDWKNKEKKIPYTSGSSLEHKYRIHAFQYRWGSDINSGSEHQLDGKSYSMELQSVYYNSEFGSYEEAESTKDGLLIYSLFYEIGSEENEFLKKLMEKFPEVMEPGTAAQIEPFALGDYFDNDFTAKYYVYHGSLTYPPCYESVIWVVSDRVISATAEQIQAFRKLNLLYKDDHNNRPLQEKNDRKVELAVRDED